MKIMTAVATVVAATGMGLVVASSSAIGTTTAQAKSSSQVIAKKWRKTYYSKPGYYFETKHIKKNMNEPKMKAVLHKKTVTWKWIGYQPKGFDKKTHVMRLGKTAGTRVFTMHGQVPYPGVMTYLSLAKPHHIMIAYQGTHTDLYR